MRAFWMELDEDMRARLVREKRDLVLRALLHRFSNDKDVTSTLVLDALYSGCKELQAGRGGLGVGLEGDSFVLRGDALSLAERAVRETVPIYKGSCEDKQVFNRAKEAAGNGVGLEGEERWMTLLGRLCCEVAVVTHLFTTRVEQAYREALSLLRQEELLREEALSITVEQAKRSKKKMAKQRKKEAKERQKQGGVREEEEGEVEEESEEGQEGAERKEDTPSASTSQDPQPLGVPPSDPPADMSEARNGTAEACIAELRVRVGWLEVQLEEKVGGGGLQVVGCGGMRRGAGMCSC